MYTPTSRQRLGHHRQVRPAVFEAQIEAVQRKARTEWAKFADYCVVGDMRDFSMLASEWLDDSGIQKQIRETVSKNVSLSETTVEKILADLDGFNGTPEEWRALASKFEG